MDGNCWKLAKGTKGEQVDGFLVGQGPSMDGNWWKLQRRTRGELVDGISVGQRPLHGWELVEIAKAN